jgi:hypothetical protein
MIRVMLPYHLQNLAHVGKEVQLQVDSPASIRLIIETLENQYPMLRGTIRDYTSGERRAFIRFFACGEDLSLDSWETPLPDAVVNGTEPFRIVGAMAGG